MRLLIAGGGTGGHLFSGVAVAEKLSAMDARAAVRFVGTTMGIEARVLPRLGWEVQYIRISGLKTVGWKAAILGLARIPGALWQSRKILKEFRPDVVLGVGGYASGPVVLMARFMGIRSAIIEQNSIPGLTNKILGRVVHRIFIAFEWTKQFFGAKKTVLSGNPIRAELVQKRISATENGGDTKKHPSVFVFGGSQGAVFVNRLVVDALKLLHGEGMFLSVLHQTGVRDVENTRKHYEEAGISAQCEAFIEDMASAYQNADLVIARAGATTVAELGCVGRAAILIPYPYAADNHQEFNARALAEGGAARVLCQADLTPDVLACQIRELLTDSGARKRMESAMNAFGRSDAAEIIVRWCQNQSNG